MPAGDENAWAAAWTAPVIIDSRARRRRGGTICSGLDGIHWGSRDSATGYLLVQLTCT